MKSETVCYFIGLLVGAWVGDVTHVLAMIFAVSLLIWIMEKVG